MSEQGKTVFMLMCNCNFSCLIKKTALVLAMAVFFLILWWLLVFLFVNSITPPYMTTTNDSDQHLPQLLESKNREYQLVSISETQQPIKKEDDYVGDRDTYENETMSMDSITHPHMTTKNDSDQHIPQLLEARRKTYQLVSINQTEQPIKKEDDYVGDRDTYENETMLIDSITHPYMTTKNDSDQHLPQLLEARRKTYQLVSINQTEQPIKKEDDYVGDRDTYENKTLSINPAVKDKYSLTVEKGNTFAKNQGPEFTKFIKITNLTDFNATSYLNEGKWYIFDKDESPKTEQTVTMSYSALIKQPSFPSDDQAPMIRKIIGTLNPAYVKILSHTIKAEDNVTEVEDNITFSKNNERIEDAKIIGMANIKPAVFLVEENITGIYAKQHATGVENRNVTSDRLPRGLKCRVPEMESSELRCLIYPNKVVCNQTCVWGHRLPTGLRTMRTCYLGNWITPNGEIDDCEPFVNCDVKLKIGGRKQCWVNSMDRGPLCIFSCDQIPQSAKYHICDIRGGWRPALPPCVTSVRGQGLAPQSIPQKFGSVARYGPNMVNIKN